MNGIDSTGDLYKLDKSNFAKRTNIATGNGSLATLLAGMRQTNAEKRRAAILSLLDLDSVNLYSVVSILIENWDGFHNNLYIYNDLSPGARWKLIPWDLDQVCENIRWDFPVTFPLTGQSLTVSRETGPIAALPRRARLERALPRWDAPSASHPPLLSRRRYSSRAWTRSRSCCSTISSCRRRR